MKTIDALNLLSITKQEVTFVEVKQAYRAACFKYHPDVNPEAGSRMMQILNDAFQALKAETFPITVEDGEKRLDYGKAINEALSKITRLHNIDIEVCGCWVWVSGETKQYKSIFKEGGFFWSGKKAMWYFRPETEKKRRWRGTTSMDQIRSKYGAESVKGRYIKALPA